MKKVIIESPYAGDVHRNLIYARACVRDSLMRGEAPIASHLIYTQKSILNDLNPEEREQGINAGLAWLNVADIQAFYIDFGISKGMRSALKKSIKQANIKIELRYIENFDEIS
jgi:hypothetical protein